MKKFNLLLTAAMMLCLTSCKEEAEQPKVIYDTPKKSTTAKVDTTQIEIADLPIQITGSEYLIHPVGDLRVIDGSRARYGGSAAGGDISYTISNYNEFEITGYLRNLKLQHVSSDSLRVLTDKPVMIQTITFVRSSDQKAQYLVYTLHDMDTNKDGRLDANDIKSLYISSISGDNFLKLSADFEELIDWRHVVSKNRIYFRSIEDTNKNGEFDKNDILHYNYLDLGAKEFAVSPYDPLK